MRIAVIGNGNVGSGLSPIPVDAGPLANARYLEPIGFLNIQFGYVFGHGTGIAPRWQFS
ncbi:hypothetical protein [Sulfitobacter sp. Ks41]|uniref:hypothetical protein n=1 Tax=Sulfitobacter sp. Ks41 TaxID=2731139 RepID=UPI0023E0D3E9|nr:hypothetical protein [Sulfitobacter sp. Ks41]